MLEPNPLELSEKSKESRAVAVTEGARATAVATAFVLASHFGLKAAGQQWYIGIPAAPKRILACVIILGAFSAGAHLSQAQHVLAENRKMR